MAFYMEVTGMDELTAKMQKLPDKGADVAALALYEGAAIVANAVSAAVQGIATEEFHYTKFGKRLPSPEEKAILLSAKRGVAKFNKNQSRVDTSVGMQNAGYGNLNGKTKPIPQIANAINSGTSFMEKQPFMRKAFNRSKNDAVEKIEQELEKRIEEMIQD